MGPRITQADASELVQGLLAPAPSEAFSIFRPQSDGTTKEFQVRMRLLRAEENIAALKAAQDFARTMGEVSKDYGDIYREAQAYEVVARSLCHPQEQERPDGSRFYRPLFVTAEQLRQAFTENEVAAALNCYEVLKAKFRCLQEADDEGIDRWAARLSDELLGAYFLGQLDSAAWPGLLMSLAREVSRLREQIGQPLPTWLDSSESTQETSESGTSGSTASVTAQSVDGIEVPQGKSITREEARDLVRKRRSEKK